MNAIVSFTDNDNYAFFAPLVKWAWNKIGIDCHFLIPANIVDTPKWKLIFSNTQGCFYSSFTSDKDKEVTYSQVGRLFLASEFGKDSETLISSDADMIPLNSQFFNSLDNGMINVVGRDLVSSDQYPMCFCAMSAEKWIETMRVDDKSYQQKLDEEIGTLQSITFRGDFWSRDQWLLFQNLQGYSINFIDRSNGQNAFAKNRVDRTDSYWRDRLNLDLIDAHLWRPGFEENNFLNILELMKFMYPQDSFDWLIQYCEEYKKLL